jgi:hypothetical protein
MEHVRLSTNPNLERTILVGAFAGWNDTASAATWALKFLVHQWDAQQFADIDPEQFFDFSAARPQARITSGSLRRITWPANRFYAHQSARDEEPEPARRDIILLLGEEPQLHWKVFSKEVLALCRVCNVEEMILLGSQVAEVPHTAPVQINGVTSQPSLLKRLVSGGIERASYNGSAGILTVLHEAARKDGMPVTSLWGVAPQYVSATPNLPVSEALLQKLDSLYGFGLHLRDVTRAAQRFNNRVSSLVADDPEVSAYVRELERRNGIPSEAEQSQSEQESFDASGVHTISRDIALPSPEQAVETVEEFFRRRPGEPGS